MQARHMCKNVVSFNLQQEKPSFKIQLLLSVQCTYGTYHIKSKLGSITIFLTIQLLPVAHICKTKSAHHSRSFNKSKLTINNCWIWEIDQTLRMTNPFRLAKKNSLNSKTYEEQTRQNNMGCRGIIPKTVHEDPQWMLLWKLRMLFIELRRRVVDVDSFLLML